MSRPLNILISGRHGQVAQELQKQLGDLGGRPRTEQF